MMRYLLLCSLLALTACQSNQLVELDYRPDYPYQSLRTWQWFDPAVQFSPTPLSKKAILMRNVYGRQLANN